MERNYLKGLFLLHEGIGSTIFNSQVVEHVLDMKKYDIHMDILSYDLLKKTRKASKNNLDKLKVTKDLNIILRKGINLFIPFLNLFNLFYFIKFIIKKNGKYQFIHARADYSAFIAILSKPIHKLPVIWDCRGDLPSEILNTLRKKKLLLRIVGKFILIPMIKTRLKIISKYADEVIFVSEALYELNCKNLRKQKIKIIPCPVSEEIFFFDKNIRNRKRNELNFKKNEVIYIYSGSMIGYQYLEGLRNLFIDILNLKFNKILIITSDQEKATEFFKCLDNDRLIILNTDFDKMVDFYNAADYGILIREKLNLNYVASPTKFGEYCLCGLPVVMNDTVDQSFKLSLKIGNHIESNNLRETIISEEERVNISSISKQYFSRSSLYKIYIELYQSLF